jgi:acetoin utilization deacetylase AcuC-like enzyme
VILHDPHRRLSLRDFGITIPIADDRAEKTLALLRAHPWLGPRAARWYRTSAAERITRADLCRAHSPAYVERLFGDGLEGEIVRTYELVDARGRRHRYHPELARQPLRGILERTLGIVSGTWQCCRLALAEGFCFYFGGGMHHAQWDFGNGFCLLNDIVVAIRKLQAEGLVRTAWVVDVDAHKGDGTAALTSGDPSILTLSVHMARGWPLDGSPRNPDGTPNPSFIPSDIDIPIESGEEDRYVARLAAGLEEMAARLPAPEIAVVVGGADPYEKDGLPSTAGLNLSLAELGARDRLVYDFLKSRRIPQAHLMAGGYGPQAWEVYAQFLPWALLDHLGAGAP